MALLRIAPEANKQGRSSYSSLALSNVLLITLSAMICVLLATDSVQAATNIPQQPALFKDKWAEVGNPLLLWTFRQQQCIGGTIEEDMGVGPDFVRQTDAACPEASSGGKTFENSVVGATSTSDTSSNTINSGAIGTSLSALTTPINTAPYQALSLALWFTPTATVSTASGRINVLLELAGAGTGADDLSSSGYQLRLAYASGSTPGANRIRLDVLIDDIDGAGETPILSLTCLNSAPVQALANAVGTRYFLGVSFYYDTGFIRFRTYLRAAGGAAVSCGSLSSNSKPNAFVFPSASVFRLGSSSSIISNIFGYRATYHLAALFNKDLPIADFDKLFEGGLPNSLPVVRTTDFAVNERTPQSGPVSHAINLNQSTVRFDFDTNAITDFTIKSLPAAADGELLLNGNPVTVNTPISDVSQLTFTIAAGKVNTFSIASGSTCPTAAFATFTFTATDGLCDPVGTPSSSPTCQSPVDATARICVVDVADPPLSTNSLNNRVRAGSFMNFTLVPTDNDDGKQGLSDNQVSQFRMRELNGAFADNTRIQFNKTVGTFGNLTAWDGTSCGAPLAVNTDVQYSVIGGARSFQYCFKSDPNAPGQSAEEIGTETFWFRFKDNGGTFGPWYTAVFTVTNPIETCPQNPPINIGTLPGLNGSVCRSIGDESQPGAATRINIYLQASDALSRSLTYRVTSLPSKGKLYTNNGGNLGTLVVAGTTEISPVSGTNPNLFYVGDDFYFNRIDRPNAQEPFRNLLGNGFGNCANVAQGCPDTFTYTAVPASGAPGTGGTYSVSVLSRPSNFTVTIPAQISINSTEYEFGNSIQVTDPDDDAYKIGVVINPAPGSVGLRNSPVVDQLTFEPASLKDCINLATCGSGFITFYGSPTRINQALALLYFVPGNSWRNTSTLEITIAKPEPHGALDGMTQSAFTNARLRYVYNLPGIIEPKPTAAPSNAADIAIIAGASAAGFLALLCALNLCIWFVRKSRRAAKAARKSMASHRSKRQSQMGGVDVDEEQQTSRSEGGGGGWCCGLCGGGSGNNNRYEDDYVDDQAGLAQHRQSAISQRSHHSQRSGGRGEPAEGRRDMIAPSVDGTDVQVADDSVFAWEKHIDRRTGDVYYFNPQTGVSQWDPPTIKVKRTGK